MKHFPSWRYHKELPARLVHGEDDDLELGDEWKHSPADFEAKPDPEAPDVPSHSDPEPEAQPKPQKRSKRQG